MTSGVYDNAIVNLMTGTVNIPHVTTGTTGTYPGVYSILANAQQTQGIATAQYGTTGANITTQIANVNGYVQGGQLVWTNVPTNSTHVTGLITNGALVYTTTATITAEWAVIQHAPTALTTSTNPLLCFLDMGAQSVTNGTLTLTWSGSGIFTLTVAAAT